DKTIADPVRKIFRVCVIADVHEWQDGNRVYRRAALSEVREIDDGRDSDHQRCDTKHHASLMAPNLADDILSAGYRLYCSHASGARRSLWTSHNRHLLAACDESFSAACP